MKIGLLFEMHKLIVSFAFDTPQQVVELLNMKFDILHCFLNVINKF